MCVVYYVLMKKALNKALSVTGLHTSEKRKEWAPSDSNNEVFLRRQLRSAKTGTHFNLRDQLRDRRGSLENYAIHRLISFAVVVLPYSRLCTIIVQMQCRPACITWLACMCNINIILIEHQQLCQHLLMNCCGHYCKLLSCDWFKNYWCSGTRTVIVPTYLLDDYDWRCWRTIVLRPKDINSASRLNLNLNRLE